MRDILATPAYGIPQAPAPRGHATLLQLLVPKWIAFRGRGRADGRALRLGLFTLVGAIFWAFAFGIVFRLLQYFRGIPEIGPLLAGKLLGLILLSFFGLLLLSNVITALSTFFLARDLDLIAAAPVDWLRVYGAKLLETIAASSWMVVLLGIPFFAAYGFAYDGGLFFPFVLLAAFIPFLVIPAVIGSALTLVLVNVFPARRTRDILGLVAVLAAAGLALLLRLMRPEQLARPEGFRSLVDFITLLRAPTSPYLPNEWAQSAIMSWLTWEPDPLAYYLLWSTAAASVVLGAFVHRALYAKGFSKAQESTARVAHRGILARMGGRVLAPAGVLRAQLVGKELRLFFRDTTQWSQLILLAVLVVVYVFNVKFLPLSGEGVTFFLVNVIPFLNLAIAGFVLASIAARFIFPAVSLEGRTLWLLRSSPVRMRDVLWSKFWVGTLPLLVLALTIVFVTDVMLQVSAFMMAVSVFTVALLTFAIAGLALGLGTLFPEFETENAAQIPTSFGGLLFMMASLAVIGAVIMLEARPVYTYLSARSFGTETSTLDMVLGFSGAAAVCLAATFVPIWLAVRRLNRGEAF
jgi:ABC-2 type transport system permease protein